MPGEHILIQGAGGAVSTAAILLAAAAGLEITVASRSSERAQRALALGSHHAVASDQRLPASVDAVLETVGAATWHHSLRSVRPGVGLLLRAQPRDSTRLPSSAPCLCVMSTFMERSWEAALSLSCS